MVKGFMFNVSWQPVPVIDRSGLIEWLKKVFPRVIGEDGLPQTKISYGRHSVAVFGEAEESLLSRVKEILEYALKNYDVYARMQWQQES